MAQDTCDVCGRELTSPESIKRHRGEKCHIVWLEQQVVEARVAQRALTARVATLEQKVDNLKGSIGGLLARSTNFA